MVMEFPVDCSEGVDGGWRHPLSLSDALGLASIWRE